MQIILISDRLAKTRSVSLSSRHLVGTAVAAMMAVLRPLWLDLIPKICRPHNLIRGILDLFAFEKVDTVLITRKINNVIFSITKRTCVPSPRIPASCKRISDSRVRRAS